MRLWVVVALLSLAVVVGVLCIVLSGWGVRPSGSSQSAVPSASTVGLPSAKAQEHSADPQTVARSLDIREDADMLPIELGEDALAVLQNELALLPFETVQLSDIHAVFAPHYDGTAGQLLTPELRTALEQAVYEEFRWRLEADAEAYTWRKQQIYEFLYGKSLSNPTHLSAQELQEKHSRLLPGIPVQRTGFADVPLVARRGRPLGVLDKSIVAHLNDKTKARLDKEMCIVTVYSAAKLTPTDKHRSPYSMTSMVFLYDPEVKVPIFYPLVTSERPSYLPDAEIPAFFRGEPLPLLRYEWPK